MLVGLTSTYSWQYSKGWHIPAFLTYFVFISSSLYLSSLFFRFLSSFSCYLDVFLGNALSYITDQGRRILLSHNQVYITDHSRRILYSHNQLYITDHSRRILFSHNQVYITDHSRRILFSHNQVYITDQGRRILFPPQTMAQMAFLKLVKLALTWYLMHMWKKVSECWWIWIIFSSEVAITQIV